MPKLKVMMPESGEVTHDLVDELITLGRVSDNMIQVEDGSVSSRHAQLALAGNGNYQLQDLGSTNGTQVNGAPVTDVVLRHGDRVRFGQIEAAYYSENHPPAAEQAESCFCFGHRMGSSILGAGSHKAASSTAYELGLPSD